MLRIFIAPVLKCLGQCLTSLLINAHKGVLVDIWLEHYLQNLNLFVVLPFVSLAAQKRHTVSVNYIQHLTDMLSDGLIHSHIVMISLV